MSIDENGSGWTSADAAEEMRGRCDALKRSSVVNDELIFSASAMRSAPESPMLLSTMTMGRSDGDEHRREREWMDECGCGGGDAWADATHN
jgi:hypothetical protein